MSCVCVFGVSKGGGKHKSLGRFVSDMHGGAAPSDSLILLVTSPITSSPHKDLDSSESAINNEKAAYGRHGPPS